MSEARNFVRRHDLDFIRVVVFGLAIIYHTSLIFGTRHWLINSTSQSPLFDIVSLMTHPWRLSILFLISGIATASLTSRLPPFKVRALRTRQLLPPVLIGTFILVPPQMFLSFRDSSGLDMSYLDFWFTYVRFGTVINRSGVEMPLVTMQQLWFLAYLWCYMTVLLLALELRPEIPALLKTRLSPVLRGKGLLIWPAIFLAVLRLTIFPIFGDTLLPQTDWYNHIVYFSIFAFGFLIADDDVFWTAVVARRYEALVVAGVSLFVVVSLFLLYPLDGRSAAMVVFHRVGRSIFQWTAILSILGFCRVLITRPHPVITYLNRAILTYYVLHQTIVVLIAYWLKKTYGLSGWSFVPLVLVTMACCAVLYEMHRRWSQSFIRRVLARSSLPPEYVAESGR
jgi:uncharacterized membrane protein